MPGAFCMMSFRIVRQNLSWPRIFLCFFSRNLFLSSTSHMVNRFSRDGATLSSACSGSTLPARTSTLETKFGDVTVQIKCKSRVLLPISDCCRGRWCSPRGSWRAGSWRRGAWRSPSCGRAAPGTCPRPADTRQYKKLFSFLSYCELLKITHNNNLPLSGPGCHQPAFLHLSIEPPGSIQQKTSAAARAPPRARSQSCHYPRREAVGAGRWNLRFLWRSQQSGMEVWMKQRDSWEDTFFAYCEYWEDAFFKYCVHWCKNWEALPGRRA